MTDWRSRLLKAVDEDGRSDRAISLAAGLGANAVNDLRNSTKVPSVDRVIRLARELKLSAAYVISGVEISREDEHLLDLFLRLEGPDRESLLGLARKLAKPERE